VSDKLVCIASFPDSGSANIARSVLDSEGIAACLDAETSNTMLAYDKAKAILAAHTEQDLIDETDSDAEHPSPSDDDEESPAERQRNDQIRRAWYAAILGTVICPVVMNVYSLYLLLGEGLVWPETPQPADWRINAALAVNLATLGFYAVLLFLGVNPY
jgi:hypothetical protein